MGEYTVEDWKKAQQAVVDAQRAEKEAISRCWDAHQVEQTIRARIVREMREQFPATIRCWDGNYDDGYLAEVFYQKRSKTWLGSYWSADPDHYPDGTSDDDYDGEHVGNFTLEDALGRQTDEQIEAIVRAKLPRDLAEAQALVHDIAAKLEKASASVRGSMLDMMERGIAPPPAQLVRGQLIMCPVDNREKLVVVAASPAHVEVLDTTGEVYVYTRHEDGIHVGVKTVTVSRSGTLHGVDVALQGLPVTQFEPPAQVRMHFEWARDYNKGLTR